MNAPKKVANHRDYWTEQPPEPSDRLLYWKKEIESGWRPNKRIRAMGYDEAAQWYGVWIWEYTNIIRALVE